MNALLPHPLGPRFAPQAAAQPDDLHFSAVWHAILRNRLLIAAVMLAALLCGAASVALPPQLYKAVASIEVADVGEDIVRDRDARVLPTHEIERYLQTQVDIIASRSLAAAVWTQLDPATRARLGPLSGDPADALQAGIDVALPPNSRVIAIGFQSEDPNAAATVANLYAAVFIRHNLQRKFDRSAYARRFLEQQLELTRARVESSDRALNAYARRADLLGPGALDASSGQSLTSANLLALNQAFSAARAARLQAQQRWSQAQATPLMNLPEVLANSSIQQLTSRRAELEAQLAEELQRRRPEHPAVRQASANIAELDRQIATVATSVRGSLRDQYLVAGRQERALSGNVAALKSASFDEQDRLVRHSILKRDADTNRELYAALLQRFKDVSASAGAANTNVSLVDLAAVPQTPETPQPVRNMALASVGGLILAFLLVGSRELFNERVRDPSQIGGKLPLHLLGVVPAVTGTPTLSGEIGEAHHALCAAIDSATGGVPGTVLITSSEPGEGKSTTALGLAAAWGSLGRRVLLIDADLRKPTLHAMLDCTGANGLADLLTGSATPEQAVRTLSEPGFDFLPAGRRHPTPASLLGGPALPKLLAGLTDRYDVIVLDGPPVLGLADAPRLAGLASATVLAVQADRLSRSRVLFALARLSGNGAIMLGAVLTRFEAARFGYGSTYRYDYGRNEDGRDEHDRCDKPGQSRLASA